MSLCTNLWAYTDELKLLWHRHLNTGHCIAARDINGDGKDEVMGGDNPLVVMGGGKAGLWNRHFDRILELPGGLQVPPYTCDVNKAGLDELLVLDGDKRSRSTPPKG